MQFRLQIDENLLAIVPTEACEYNKIYKVTICPGLSGYLPDLGDFGYLENKYEFWFTSQYCPLFTTLTKVKLMAGPGSDYLSDDTIYRMIYKNSLDAIELYNTSYTTTYNWESFGCPVTNAPAELKKYVECKTAFDILSILDLADDGSLGQTKTLGDMSIKYDAKGAGGSDPSNNRKKELYDCFMGAMNVITGIKAAVRGWYDTSKGYSHPTMSYTSNRVVKPDGIYSDFSRVPGSLYWKRI